MAPLTEILQPEELQSIVNLQLMAKQTVEGAISLVQRGVMLWLLVLLALAASLNAFWSGGIG